MPTGDQVAELARSLREQAGVVRASIMADQHTPMVRDCGYCSEALEAVLAIERIAAAVEAREAEVEELHEALILLNNATKLAATLGDKYSALIAEIAGLRASLCDRDEERRAWREYAEAGGLPLQRFMIGAAGDRLDAARARLVSLGELRP